MQITDKCIFCEESFKDYGPVTIIDRWIFFHESCFSEAGGEEFLSTGYSVNKCYHQLEPMTKQCFSCGKTEEVIELLEGRNWRSVYWLPTATVTYKLKAYTIPRELLLENLPFIATKLMLHTNYLSTMYIPYTGPVVTVATN